jgi:uncharacterized protein (DUF1684 family)
MRFLIYIQALVIMSLALSCREQADYPPGSYEAQVVAYRAQKDSSFRFSESSPLPDELKKSFKALNYFKPDSNFVIKAKFTPNPKPDTIKVFTSKKEDVRTMLRIGTFEFKIKGRTMKLTGYVNAPVEYPADVFIPFADKTNGIDTYEGGRYLDIMLDDSSEQFVVLDFNLAYAPYCAYNKKYSCPLVPYENVLAPYIKAGEKIYKKK